MIQAQITTAYIQMVNILIFIVLGKQNIFS